MVLDYRLGKINSLLSQRHQYRLWITARKLSVISAANSASVKIFATSYSFNVELLYMKQNRSVLATKKVSGNFEQSYLITTATKKGNIHLFLKKECLFPTSRNLKQLFWAYLVHITYTVLSEADQWAIELYHSYVSSKKSKRLWGARTGGSDKILLLKKNDQLYLSYAPCLWHAQHGNKRVVF